MNNDTEPKDVGRQEVYWRRMVDAESSREEWYWFFRATLRYWLEYLPGVKS